MPIILRTSPGIDLTVMPFQYLADGEEARKPGNKSRWFWATQKCRISPSMLYIYTYIVLYIYIYIYMYIWLCIYIYMYTNIQIDIYLYICQTQINHVIMFGRYFTSTIGIVQSWFFMGFSSNHGLSTTTCWCHIGVVLNMGHGGLLQLGIRRWISLYMDVWMYGCIYIYIFI